MSSNERFHKAARDGFLDLLKEANKRDCNSPDEDGMTPTLLAAACGNLDALRLIVGRGGNPDKCDLYGNTALHCAAANGHINCVSFLANFGINLWALDNQFHTAKDVAGTKNNEEVLRLLDEEMNKQAKLNRKSVQNMKEKAVKDAEKRVKDYQKLMEKTQKQAEKLEKKSKEREKLGATEQPRPSLIGIAPTLRRDSRALYQHPIRYSDYVNPQSGGKKVSGVNKKIQQQKMKASVNGNEDFKVRKMESDGHQTVSSISGLRRDSEILYVTKYDTSPSGDSLASRQTLQEAFHAQNGSQMYVEENSVGIFERPGFGNVAFRKNSLTGALLSSMSMEYRGGKKRPTLSGVTGDEVDDENKELGSAGEGSAEDSIGSAGSLARRNKWAGYSHEDDDDDDDDDDHSSNALETFLTAHELMPCYQYLRREHIDLKALLLLSENDLKEIGIPMGIRKKMMEAISRRKGILHDAGEVYDSRL